MRVYVAGKFERKAEVNEIQKALIDAGHEVTFDWTKHTAVGKFGQGLTDYLRVAAEDDLQGVLECEAILLLHDDSCRGGFAEFGIAAGLKKLLVVVGGRMRPGPIFYNLPEVNHFDVWQKAVEWLTWADTFYVGREDKP